MAIVVGLPVESTVGSLASATPGGDRVRSGCYAKPGDGHLPELLASNAVRGLIYWPLMAGLCAAACSADRAPLATAERGVVFTYPVDAQLDVPLGTRVVVTFSDPVTETALGACSGQGNAVVGAFCLVGPDGPLDAKAEVVGDGHSVQFAAPAFEPGTTYAVFVRSPVNPSAENL